MSAPEVVTGIDRVQPTVFAVQVALAAAMKSYGVTPGAVIGHSMGEVAAAVVAGALSLEDGVKVICRRSRLMSRIAGSGAMASVELPAPQVLSELAARGVSDVSLAVVASPQSTVIGGATQSVRELVAEWEERGVMAREVAVDVASHSPQVDPILDELADVLADLSPMEPEIPYYSATLYDPRDLAEWDADYWVDNLRHAVRFAAAVQAALEDGHRVFAELSPHPLLTHAVEQTARSLDMPLAVLAAMRRQQEMPHGLRGFVADLHSVGAAVDFSVLFPAGRLVDAPLPTWIAHVAPARPRGSRPAARGGAMVAVHPLLGAHVVLPEEPERHLWQGEVGTEAQPWLADHQVHEVAVLPGAAYCEMALAAARRRPRRGLRGPRRVLRADADARRRDTGVRLGVGGLAWRRRVRGRDIRGRRTHTAGHRGPARRCDRRRAGDLRHRRPAGGTSRRRRRRRPAVGFRHRGHPLRRGIRRAGDGLHRRKGGGHRAGLGRAAGPAPVPAGRLRGAPRTAGRLLPVGRSRIPTSRPPRRGGMLLPLGVRRLRAHASARNAHYCYGRVVSADADGVEADIELLDEHGAVLLSVTGLRLGTGVSEGAQADRLLNDRLLTIDWQHQELPDVDDVDAGSWLLVSTADNGDVLAAELGEALKSAGAGVHGDGVAAARRPRGQCRAAHARIWASSRCAAWWSLAAPRRRWSQRPTRRSAASSVSATWCASRASCQRLPGEPPRLYVVTRNAQSVVADDVRQPGARAGCAG